MSGRVRMGAAKVNITPPVGTHLGGYGNRRRPSDDIHDELYAAAYVFADDSSRRLPSSAPIWLTFHWSARTASVGRLRL